MAAEIPKGLRLVLQMVGITPEMLANPAMLLQQFGINPAELHKFIADMQQIGLIAQSIDARLARIEAHCGIDPTDARSAGSVAPGEGGQLRKLDG